MSATHDWPNVAGDLVQALKPLRAGAPAAMTAFGGLARPALESKALSTKTKELIALAISVATRCDGCIAFHAEAAGQAGRQPGGNHGDDGACATARALD